MEMWKKMWLGVFFLNTVYICRLLTRIKRTCYTTENKILQMQMSKKKKEHNIIHKKHMQLDNETN